jgi:ribA/ribD-fused uncharacterized protein
MNTISGFFGRSRWLSNFVPARVLLDGVEYPSVEHAYQAAKSLLPYQRQKIGRLATALEAKRAGKSLTISPCWNSRKLAVMRGLLEQKFALEPYRTQLLNTGTAQIVETNYWKDCYWGVCNGVGENHLGRLLMEVRQQLQHQHQPVQTGAVR